MKKIPLAVMMLGLIPAVGMASIGITTPAVNSGELIRASDWNKIRLDLQTLAGSLEALSNQSWSSSGANIYYTAGSVGIGTNSPTGLMHLYADTPQPDAALLQLGTSDDADRVRIDEDGDMTIDGKLLVRDSDIYDSDGDLELSGEDSLYLTMDWNNDDADTQAILLGKNYSGAGADFVELMRLDESGNVGIGTATPNSKLQVDGSIQVGSDAGACDADKTGAMRFAGGAIERCDGTAWDALATTNVSDNLGSHIAEQNIDLGIFTLVGNGGTEGITIADDGNVQVGVGATGLDGKMEISGGPLVVSSNTANTSRIAVVATGTGDADLIFDAQDGDVSGGDYAWIGQKNDGSFFINNASADRINILPNGNVGIGETSPDSLLQIVKTSPTANETLLRLGTDTEESRFTVDEDGDVYSDGNYFVGGGNVISPIDGGSLTVGGEDNLYLAMDRTNDDADSRSIVFGKNGVGASANWEELMRVDESGKVGINTITPATRLHVIENTSTDRIATFENQATTGSPEGLLVLTGQGAGPAPAFAVGTGTEASHSNNFVVTNEGRVGVGQVNPGYDVDVAGDVNVTGNFLKNGNPFSGGGKFVDGTNSDDAVYTTGNVGVGIGSPEQALHVLGQVRADRGSNQLVAHDVDGDPLGSINILGNDLDDSGDMRLSPANAAGAFQARLTIEGDTGNVGIGTFSPESRLDVRGNAKIKMTPTGPGQPILELENTSQTNSTYITLKAGNLGTAQGGTISHTGPNNPVSRWRDSMSMATRGINGLVLKTNSSASTADIRFETSATTPGEPNPKMIIKNSGNVGIGTESPTTKLVIRDDAGEIDLAVDFDPYQSGVAEGVIKLITQGTGNPHMSLSTKTNNDQLFLSSTGNVGIGTTDPVHLLHVSGPSAEIGLYDTNPLSNANSRIARYPDALTIQNDSSGTWVDNIILTDNGNVGIGMTSPSEKLTVNGNMLVSSGVYTMEGTADFPTGTSDPYIGRGANGYLEIGGRQTAHSAADIVFKTVDNERMRIDENGNVGIGTTSPQSTLDINQSGSISGVRITGSDSAKRIIMGNQDSQGVNNPSIIHSANGVLQFGGGDSWAGNGGTMDVSMTISDAGNVGIGTTAPTARLSVNGSANKPGGGSWGTFSDIRLKDQAKFKDYEYGLDEVMKLQPIYYNYAKNNALDLPSDETYVGFAAQDMQKVLPDAVDDSSDFLEINNDPILWAMLNAIKELKAQNEVLEERLKALEQ